DVTSICSTVESSTIPPNRVGRTPIWIFTCHYQCVGTKAIVLPLEVTMRQTMKANVFVGTDKIEIRNKPIPNPGFNEALVRITLTTICGTNLHIVRGEYPVKPGLTIGHEPVGVIEELGPGISGCNVGDRVLIGAITPCGQCEFCLSGKWSQCGGRLGGWKFGNTIDGCQAEFVLVPNAQANLARIPDSLADEDVVLLADIASTGISASETA